MASRKGTRTVYLERVVTFLRHLRQFQESVEPFRARWGIPAGGFAWPALEAQPGLASTVHQVWAAYGNPVAELGEGSRGSIITALGHHPLERIDSPQVLEDLAGVLGSAGWVSHLNLTEANRQEYGSDYWKDLGLFVDEWRRHVPALMALGIEEATHLLLDLLYQPEVLREQLRREYRQIDFLEDLYTGIKPDEYARKVALRHTFTTLYPDARVNIAGDNVTIIDLQITFLPGTSSRAISQLHTRLRDLVKDKPAAIHAFGPLPEEREGESYPSNTTLWLVQALARASSGLGFPAAMAELHEKLFDKGKPDTGDELRARAQQLEAEGFTFIE